MADRPSRPGKRKVTAAEVRADRVITNVQAATLEAVTRGGVKKLSVADVRADGEKITALLIGRRKNDRTHEYLEPGGGDEMAGFAALARVLRSDFELSWMLRRALAELFDPDPDSDELRRLVFCWRKEGRRGDTPIDVSIAFDIAADIYRGRQVKAAVSRAVEHYGVSERTVTRAWQKHGVVARTIVEAQTEALEEIRAELEAQAAASKVSK